MAEEDVLGESVSGAAKKLAKAKTKGTLEQPGHQEQGMQPASSIPPKKPSKSRTKELEKHPTTPPDRGLRRCQSSGTIPESSRRKSRESSQEPAEAGGEASASKGRRRLMATVPEPAAQRTEQADKGEGSMVADSSLTKRRKAVSLGFVAPEAEAGDEQAALEPGTEHMECPSSPAESSAAASSSGQVSLPASPGSTSSSPKRLRRKSTGNLMEALPEMKPSEGAAEPAPVSRSRRGSSAAGASPMEQPTQQDESPADAGKGATMEPPDRPSSSPSGRRRRQSMTRSSSKGAAAEPGGGELSATAPAGLGRRKSVGSALDEKAAADAAAASMSAASSDQVASMSATVSLPIPLGRRRSLGALGTAGAFVTNLTSEPSTGMKAHGVRRRSLTTLPGFGGGMTDTESLPVIKARLTGSKDKPIMPTQSEKDDDGGMPGADEQFDLIERFRRHLLKHFGSALEAFNCMDANGDGELTFEELLTAFDKYNISESDDEGYFDLRRVFLTLDTDGSNALSCDELMSAPRSELVAKMTKRKRHRNVELPSTVSLPPVKNTVERMRRLMLRNFKDLKAAFKAMDKDGSGELSFAELKNGMKRRGITPSDELGMIDMKAAFKTMDVDNSGEISIYEFQGFFPRRKKGKKKVGKRKSMKTSSEKNPQEEFVPECERQPGHSASLQQIELFGANKEAQSLNLRHACVGEWGAHRLAFNMHVPDAGSRSLKLLQLEGNYIGDTGVEVLADAIERSCAVTRLVLGWNGLSDVAAIRLSKTITKMNLTLLELILASNHISDKGASCLADALSKKDRPKLKTLDLSRNLIGSEGQAALLKADNEKLKLLLFGNRCELMDDKEPIAKDALWSQDADYVVARSYQLLTSSYSSMPKEPHLTVDLAASLSQKAGNSWLPTVELRQALAKAKAMGNGEIKPARQVRMEKEDEGVLSALAGLDI